MAVNYSDNTVQTRGYGSWLITIYKPDKDGQPNCGMEKGPYDGVLYISKDWTYVQQMKGVNSAGEYVCIKDGCLFNVASQNVAFIESIFEDEE